MKNLLTLLFLLLAGTTITQAQTTATTPYSLNFTSLHDMPVKLMWPATITDGQDLYAINGFGGNVTADFMDRIYKYDTKADSWSIVSKNTTSKAMTTAVYLPETKSAYVFGGMMDGFNNCKVFQGTEKIDLITGKVTTTKALFNPMATIATASAVYDGKIYLFGGTEAMGATKPWFYSFDPKTAEFTKLADMPEGVETTGTIVNGVLYTFGGMDRYNGTASIAINAYDIKTGSWAPDGALPEAVSSNCIASYGNVVFLIGNNDDETFLGYYDTVNKKFIRLQSNMKGRRGAGAIVIGNKLYVYGGKSGYIQEVGGGLNTIQCADLSQFDGLNKKITGTN